MYQGATADVGEDFSARSFPLPPYYNPADWVLEVSEENNVDELEKVGFFPRSPDVPKPADKTLEYPEAIQTGVMLELKMLLEREKRNYVRNPARIGFTIFVSFSGSHMRFRRPTNLTLTFFPGYRFLGSRGWSHLLPNRQRGTRRSSGTSYVGAVGAGMALLGRELNFVALSDSGTSITARFFGEYSHQRHDGTSVNCGHDIS